MIDTEMLPDRQVEVLRVVQGAPGPTCTRLVALRLRLQVPVASRVLNRLAGCGVISYDEVAEGWVTRG